MQPVLLRFDLQSCRYSSELKNIHLVNSTCLLPHLQLKTSAEFEEDSKKCLNSALVLKPV